VGQQEAPGETEEAETATGAVNSQGPGRRSIGPPHLHLRRHHGWQIEQGYQQLKEELGLDHFEGRSWRGFHHHAAMALLAYGFLLLERQRVREHRPRGRKKGVARRC
jgi:SRSO17 transposase